MKKNGKYPIRNIETGMAKGKYMAVMDANTMALPDRLWKQYMICPFYLQKDRYNLLVSKMTVVFFG